MQAGWNGNFGLSAYGGSAPSVPKIWAQAISSRNVGTVMALYCPNAVLVPTFSRTILRGAPQLSAYFQEFLARPGLRCKIDSELVQDISPDCMVASGDYTFTQKTGSGSRKAIRARFTYVLVRDSQGTWKIATQHSSAMPKE
jgi:uncharacterized protein (TIGR02246 family)